MRKPPENEHEVIWNKLEMTKASLTAAEETRVDATTNTAAVYSIFEATMDQLNTSSEALKEELKISKSHLKESKEVLFEKYSQISEMKNTLDSSEDLLAGRDKLINSLSDRLAETETETELEGMKKTNIEYSSTIN